MAFDLRLRGAVSGRRHPFKNGTNNMGFEVYISKIGLPCKDVAQVLNPLISQIKNTQGGGDIEHWKCDVRGKHTIKSAAKEGK